MKNVLIVDGNSILNRAFYGIRPLTTASGQQTAAIYGMLNMLKGRLDALHPEYAAVTFDVHAPTFRHQVYEEYKAGRRPTPPELLSQFAPAKECLSCLGLPVLELPGYEADDLQGTVARIAAKAGAHAYIFTGDRDLLQLIDQSTTVLLASNNDTLVMDRNAFFEKYGVEPEQFVDVKAIMGDSSDHIPGVPGIGEKGALKLIATFGSLDGVYAHLEDASITKGVREKLIAGKESAYQSQFLARICTEAPIDGDLETYLRRPVDNDGLYRAFLKLEFSAMIRKFGLQPPKAAEAPGAEAAPSLLDGLLQEPGEEEKEPPLPGAEPEGEKETEEEGEMPPLPASYLASLPYEEATAKELLSRMGNTVAVDWRQETEEGYFFDGYARLHYAGPLSEIAELFHRPDVILAEGKAFLHLLWDAGVEGSFVPKDVLLAAYVRSPGGNARLESLFADLVGVIPTQEEGHAHLLLALWKRLVFEVERIGCRSLLFDTELPLAPVLARMERVGFRLDVAALVRFGKELLEASVDLADAIYGMAGETFNIQSPKQLSEVLFDRLMLPPGKAKKNKNGTYSTDAEVLEALVDKHPIVEMILEYRHITKLYSTYAQGLLEVVDGEGRVHTDFKQTLTATGRLSSADPNLQNIPIRTKLGREMRRFFITGGEDYLLVDADYSQIELRLLAAISGDEGMTAAFKAGEDIHRKTAAAVFHRPLASVTEEMRKAAKAVNFGIVYGISAYSLSGDLRISVAEAKRYIAEYFAEYPGIEGYLSAAVKEAEEKGYTKTLLGRRRYIPELSSPNHALRQFGKRVAMNSPIQGSAADIIKVAMVRVDRRLREEGLDARLVMQVHDELIVEAHASCVDRVKALLKEEMEKAASLAVPLVADVGVGSTWLTAKG